MSQIKNFVLDTSVLIHDPRSLFNFDEHHVWIPVDVLEDLDHLKTEHSDRGLQAREVIRHLDKIFRQSQSMKEGVQSPGGGTIRVAFRGDHPLPAHVDPVRAKFSDSKKIDNRIIQAALNVSQSQPPPTVLVTKDINMSLKGRAVGLETDDYLTDKIHDPDIHDGSPLSLEVSVHEMQRFASSGFLEVDPNRMPEVSLNEYLLLRSGNDKTMPARCCGNGQFKKLSIPPALTIPGGVSIKPLNLGQQCFVDALLDPEVTFVTGYGKAGTGKTLVAVAAGLSQVYQRSYRRLIVSRSVVPMGDTLGFLPGDLDEKLRPWLQPIYDAIEFLHTPNGSLGVDSRKNAAKKKRIMEEEEHSHSSHGGPNGKNTIKKPHEKLMEQGLLDIEALCHIRGRSIPNTFYIVDEAQQLSPLEAKTIVTRMSKGSKLVFLGDPGQIDNPYVDAYSNGLVYARNKLKGQAITAHISLTRGERSVLADLGAELL